MIGSFKTALPRSGFVQQVNKTGKITLGFAPTSLILANKFCLLISR
jgi:hypothetical protein